MPFQRKVWTRLISSKGSAISPDDFAASDLAAITHDKFFGTLKMDGSNTITDIKGDPFVIDNANINMGDSYVTKLLADPFHAQKCGFLSIVISDVRENPDRDLASATGPLYQEMQKLSDMLNRQGAHGTVVLTHVDDTAAERLGGKYIIQVIVPPNHIEKLETVSDMLDAALAQRNAGEKGSSL